VNFVLFFCSNINVWDCLPAHAVCCNVQMPVFLNETVILFTYVFFQYGNFSVVLQPLRAEANKLLTD